MVGGLPIAAKRGLVFRATITRGFKMALAAKLEPEKKQQPKSWHPMITLDAFLVLLFAASLPATYIFICSRWIEPAYRESGWTTPTEEKTAVVGHKPAQQAA